MSGQYSKLIAKSCLRYLWTENKLEQSVWELNTISRNIGYLCPSQTFEDTQGQTKIVKSEDRQEQAQQNENRNKHITHNTRLKTKAEVTCTHNN